MASMITYSLANEATFGQSLGLACFERERKKTPGADGTVCESFLAARRKSRPGGTTKPGGASRNVIIF